MSDFNLIANSGIQFHSLKVNLGMKSEAMKANADFTKKLKKTLRETRRFSSSSLITTKNFKNI